MFTSIKINGSCSCKISILYTVGQEPPDEYLDKVIQSWAYLEGHDSS
jgi:hypothetical protein